ncbi:acyltransferase [Aliigemmobacter aestuarii]|uniref:Acyltransferase n=1 Tax=Aliigemmobacter aestuarii TaxID=1445661 RepID=A0A4S3MMU4_9RHOB|nr:acyltransferase [Gemmobacter aestuarii]THD82187.1 acyltransferase [Gemmobacter aestuarii]
MSPRPATHIHGLDLLRFVAAMLVVLNHFATYATDQPEVTMDRSLRAYDYLDPFVGIGATGVQIFFVISGFVIAMSAARLSGAAGAMRFALARMTRILPALWLSTAISLVALILCGFDPGPLLARAARSAVLSPIGPYIDGVVWSLVVEAVFYLLIGLAILCWARLPLARIAIALGLASSAFLALLLAATLTGHHGAAALMDRFPFKVFLLHHGVFFAIGMLVWHAMSQPLTPRLRLFLGLFTVMGLIELWLLNQPSTPRAIGSMLVWAAAMGWLLLSIRRPLFASRPGLMRFLGDLSYPIYLNHYTTGMATVFLLHQAGVSGLPSLVLALGVVGLASVGVVLAERRVRARLRPLIWPAVPGQAARPAR